MFGLALMFPCYFVLANSVGRSSELSMEHQFVVRAIITAAIFGGIPALISMLGRVSWSTGFGIRKTSLLDLVGAAILGVSLWPAAHEIALLCQEYGFLALNPEIVRKVDVIVKQFQAMPLWLILATFALVPAVFEELCFRGFLFGAFRQRFSRTWTVVATALLFGFFHEVLFPGKLIPTTLLGLVLGWVRLRTGSILPGIVLHALLDGFVLSIIYYRDELVARGWGVQEESHLPLAWHGAALVGIAVGIALLIATTRATSTDASESSSSDLAANRYW
jgi:ABC-2 type transport system permease protein/sodium transport system permease protein